MKQETNNEIDLLLRRLSRRDGSLVGDAEAQEQHLGQHLDGDELSSYAQNALPSSARARYTEHLADCSNCRKLVTELSLSLGTTAAAAAPIETVAEPSGLKKFLASLFSPMVLRYAVPALGLIVVAVVGFVILRDPNRKGFVAQVDVKQNQPAPVTTAPQEPAFAESPAGFTDSQRQTENQSRVAEPKTTTPRSESTTGDTAGAGPAPAPVAPVRDENAAAAPKPQSSPSSAAEAPPAAKTAAPAETEEQKKKDAVAKAQARPAVTVQSADAEVSSKQANEPVRDFSSAKEAERRRVDDSKREALPAQRGATVGSVSALGRSQTEKNSDADTRTVAGRRFRKQRGIWTDTAYDSGTATVNMARGSEQFRALIADEPEIKRIAEQLDGEVIVVWKGRAYRIR